MRGLSRCISGLVGPRCRAEVRSEEAARGAGRPSTVQPSLSPPQGLGRVSCPRTRETPNGDSAITENDWLLHLVSPPPQRLGSVSEHVSLMDV